MCKVLFLLSTLQGYSRKIKINADFSAFFCILSVSLDMGLLNLEKWMTHSMSHPGTLVDNAVIESFHRSIKRELIDPNKYKTRAELSLLLQDYLTDYYINKRVHTKFMMTPPSSLPYYKRSLCFTRIVP